MRTGVILHADPHGIGRIQADDDRSEIGFTRGVFEGDWSEAYAGRRVVFRTEGWDGMASFVRGL